MRRLSLLQVIWQLVFFTSALAAHERKDTGEVTKLTESHYNSIPSCMVSCMSRIHRSQLPHCTPDQYYDYFDVGKFIRDQDVAGCFCRDVFFLKGFAECIVETCDSSWSFYRAVSWGYNTCAASGVDLTNIQNLPDVSEIKAFRQWSPPRRWMPHHWIRHHHRPPNEYETATATSASTVTSTVATTATIMLLHQPAPTNAPQATTTAFVQLVEKIITTTITSGSAAVTTMTTTTTALSAPTPTPTRVPGVPVPKRKEGAGEVIVEAGLQSFSGPGCVATCYEDPNKAGWFTDDKYKDDIHPECKSIYAQYEENGMSTKEWSDRDERKLSRCVCTHRSYVKALSECGIAECSTSNGEAEAAILFGYQVCSKKGMIEFPYVDTMIEKLDIKVPANISLPDRVTIATHGVGGAPTFPILDEDGEKMMFPNGAEHTGSSAGSHSFLIAFAVIVGTVAVFL